METKSKTIHEHEVIASLVYGSLAMELLKLLSMIVVCACLLLYKYHYPDDRLVGTVSAICSWLLLFYIALSAVQVLVLLNLPRLRK